MKRTPTPPPQGVLPRPLHAGIDYEPQEDVACIRLRDMEKGFEVIDFAQGVVLHQDQEEGCLLGVMLLGASRNRWNIESIILHYRARQMIRDVDVVVLRHLAQALRAVMVSRGRFPVVH